MKYYLLLIAVFFFNSAKSQSNVGIDSFALQNKYHGAKVPDMTFIDTLGNKVRLSSFRGKIIYLDFWSTTCAPCIKLFPVEERLHSKIRSMGIDTSIVFIKICDDCPENQWKKIIQENQSSAVNLKTAGKGYKFRRKFRVTAYPVYQLISRKFTYITERAIKPDNPTIEDLLLQATNEHK